MEYYVALSVFGVFFYIVYSWPFLIFLLVGNIFFVNVFPKTIYEGFQLILAFSMVYQLIISQYRAKLAADCRVNSSMTFKETFTTSKVLFNNNLSFLPVIGIIYKRKNK